MDHADRGGARATQPYDCPEHLGAEPPEAAPDATDTASPAEEPSTSSDELRAALLARFAELRSAALHDPQRFVATRRALQTASGRLDELGTPGLVLQHGAELRDFLALQVRTLALNASDNLTEWHPMSADALASELGILATKAQIENLRSTQEAASAR